MTKYQVSTSPVISSDSKTLYVGSLDGNLYAIHTVDGSKARNYSTASVVSSPPTLSADGLTVYIGINTERPAGVNETCYEATVVCRCQ